MSLISNLGAGNYTALQRARKIAGNLVLKIRKRSMCCGNYGDPGC